MSNTLFIGACLLIILSPLSVHSVCPFLLQGTPPNQTAEVPQSSEYDAALANLDIAAVFTDIDALLTDSQECWPADTFSRESSYGPLFVRLAWHCSGTFRDSDGEGGCAGGRQRFPPEASWDDNVNLDKARALLAPIKEKYGDGLSWGDLMVFAGTASILNMEGPVTEICAGRIDDRNGSASDVLETPACEVQGNCSAPLGMDTVGLIYVNPAGVMGDPVPSKSAPRIREVFGRMGMNDEETVALIGGGHAFGKAHGACEDGAGSSPDDAPYNPWPGNCGTGKGDDTFTSGFEGQWTSNPLKWDNEYFMFLVDDNYTLITGSGGNPQWENEDNGYMMLTADLALIEDAAYLAIVESFANDIEVLNTAFAAAWEKLTTSGGTWSTQKKCVNADELYASTTTGLGVDTTETTKKDTPPSEVDEAWKITGIVFICLFGVSLIVICYLAYVLMGKNRSKQRVSDGRGDYTNAPAIETQAMKQTGNV